MPSYTIADQFDFDADADGVTLHIWFPGERHLRMTWEQWDAMNGEVDKRRPAPEPVVTITTTVGAPQSMSVPARTVTSTSASSKPKK